MALALVVGAVAGLVNGLIITRFRRAAADRHPGHPRALSRPGRGHQPGALGARLSGMVLRPRPGRGRSACRSSSGSCSSSPSSPPSILGLTTFGRTTYAIGANETAARFSGIARRPHQAADLHRLRADRRARRRDLRVARVDHALGHGHRPRARRHHRRRPRRHQSIFGGRGTIIGTVLGLILMQALKNGLALAGRQGRRHDRRDRRGADPRDPDRQPVPTATATAEPRRRGPRRIQRPAQHEEEMRCIRRTTCGPGARRAACRRCGAGGFGLDRRRRSADQPAGLRRRRRGGRGEAL